VYYTIIVLLLYDKVEYFLDVLRLLVATRRYKVIDRRYFQTCISYMYLLFDSKYFSSFAPHCNDYYSITISCRILLCITNNILRIVFPYQNVLLKNSIIYINGHNYQFFSIRFRAVWACMCFFNLRKLT